MCACIIGYIGLHVCMCGVFVSTGRGWRAKVSPDNHPLNSYEFDAITGADGKQNTLKGRCRLTLVNVDINADTV